MKPEMGTNRTGMLSTPGNAASMQALELQPIADGGGRDTYAAVAPVLAFRRFYANQATPLGAIPPPRERVDGIEQPARLAILLDRLGERLAFERFGTRLYQAFVQKCQLRGDEAGGLPLNEFTRFCEEEAQHMRMLADAITRLGGDPTSQTPSADAAGMQNAGLIQVIASPSTTVCQSLQAILTAELTDECAWGLLIAMTRDLGVDDLTETFRHALGQEEEHLRTVRRCYEAMSLQESRTGAMDR